MNTFKEFRRYIHGIQEAFILLEMPQLSDSNDKITTQNMSDIFREGLKHNHDKSSKEFDTLSGSVYKFEPNKDNQFYYHMVDGNPREFSHVENNTHKFTHKSYKGDSKIIHDIMCHHIRTHGSLSSSDDNSSGSKHLWINLIHSSPKNIKFHITPSNKEVNTYNIDSESNKIWGKYDEYKKFRIVGSKND